MKKNTSTEFMMTFVQSYLDGERSRMDFDLDFSHYLIKHYKKMVEQARHEGAQQAGEQGAPDAGSQTQVQPQAQAPAQTCCRKPTDANPEKGQGGGQC